jgi:cytochrome c553
MTAAATLRRGGVLAFGSAAAMLVAVLTYPGEAAAPPATDLRDAASFASIRSADARSQALFTEAAKVIMHPRCMNCHPATRRPTHGDDMHPHEPPMFAGEGNIGPAGLACSSCHGDANVATYTAGIRSIPGNSHWSLAPASMAWQSLSMGDICRQVRDPKRNGSRDLEAIYHHMAEDHLVGWTWHPGDGRVPAPGTQQAFGQLIRGWIDTGAKCPA